MKIKFYLITLHTARPVFVRMLCALFAEKCMTFYVSSEIVVMENTHILCSDRSLTFSVPLDQTLIFSKTHSLDNQIHESLSMVTLWVLCLDTVSQDCFIHRSTWTIQARAAASAQKRAFTSCSPLHSQVLRIASAGQQGPFWVLVVFPHISIPQTAEQELLMLAFQDGDHGTRVLFWIRGFSHMTKVNSSEKDQNQDVLVPVSQSSAEWKEVWLIYIFGLQNEYTKYKIK